MRSLAVVNATQLVTLAGPASPRRGLQMRHLQIIEAGSMLIQNGLITAVGSIDVPADAEIIDAKGKVVLPGWIDGHTHAVFAGNRVNEFEMRSQGATYEQIASSGGGIQSTMRATRQASQDALVEAGKRHARWFLQNGTTTVECKSGYGLSTEAELKMLQAIGQLQKQTPLTWIPTFLGAHAFPPEFAQDPDGYVALVLEEMLPKAAPLSRYCDIFVERNYFTVDQARIILTRAKQLGLRLRMHVDQLTDSGGASLAVELGATTADHLEQTSAAGIDALARSDTIAVLLPGSVYALGLDKYPEARQMIDQGVPVVVATDFNPGSSPTPSIPMVLSLACTQMKLTPAEAVTAATINAAYSLDLGHDRGSLEPGKRADFAIYDCRDYREIAYWFGASLLDRVFIEGREVSYNAVTEA